MQYHIFRSSVVSKSSKYLVHKCLRVSVGMVINENDYRQTFNISRTSVCNKIVDHSDVVGASPVGAAPTTFAIST